MERIKLYLLQIKQKSRIMINSYVTMAANYSILCTILQLLLIENRPYYSKGKESANDL